MDLLGGIGDKFETFWADYQESISKVLLNRPLNVLNPT